ncbi:hypothetical protein HLH36_05600 [Gluconacetobacter aggeris]|uniref:Uncharacterized protein n=1 Tax=Gluconacetobacter aggeris TaxID=1286186 RepID=A0A7W4NYP5_9PROT|nr:hypothetical protein [Gluconacetobacter aggeris]MBB2167835.1 hypothetical protein [Gluconacetobacter aggeris]
MEVSTEAQETRVGSPPARIYGQALRENRQNIDFVLQIEHGDRHAAKRPVPSDDDILLASMSSCPGRNKQEIISPGPLFPAWGDVSILATWGTGQ